MLRNGSVFQQCFPPYRHLSCEKPPLQPRGVQQRCHRWGKSLQTGCSGPFPELIRARNGWGWGQGVSSRPDTRTISLAEPDGAIWGLGVRGVGVSWHFSLSPKAKQSKAKQSVAVVSRSVPPFNFRLIRDTRALKPRQWSTLQSGWTSWSAGAHFSVLFAVEIPPSYGSCYSSPSAAAGWLATAKREWMKEGPCLFFFLGCLQAF